MVVSLASSAYLASAASTLGLVQSAIGLHSIVKRPLYGFDEVLLEALRDSLPKMIALEATEQSLSLRPLVELDKTEVHRSTTSLSFRAILDATCSPHSANLLSSIDPSDSGRRSYSIYLSGPGSREP